ncbi:DNA fragmentation factor subunit beta isoform X2 [Rattus norvegicus]|uniref:DNA fragmentation factor subunit beta isoform X2 n=1 Tax=Rattus norvegicus TaxID=10116 RepID=UPI002FD7BB87
MLQGSSPVSSATRVRYGSSAMCAVLPQPKCVKLRALHSSCKFGVAARSCQELLRKGCIRFQLPVPGSRLCMYEDGTEVTDDCFPSLPNDSELLLLTAGETWHGSDVSDITRLLSVFNEPHAGVIQAARQLLSDEQAPLRQKLLADLLHHVSQNITAETREQDPSWFEGLESRFRNKSGYLRYSCESRIRGYLREVSGAKPRQTGGRENTQSLSLLDNQSLARASRGLRGQAAETAGERLHLNGGCSSPGRVPAGPQLHVPQAQVRAVQRQLFRQRCRGQQPPLYPRRLVLLPGPL